MPSRRASRARPLVAVALAVASIVPFTPARGLVPYQGWTPSSLGMLPECGKYETSGYLVSGCLITRRIRFHPGLSGVAVVGTLRQGPFITTNGSTWTPLAPHCLSTLYTVESAVGNGLTACGVEDIAFDPLDSQTIYVTAFEFSSPLLIGYNIQPAGVFRSTNLGQAWEKISPPIRGAGLAVIRRPGEKATIMAGQIQHTDWDIGTSISMIVSHDAGASWRNVTLPPAPGCSHNVFLSTSKLVATFAVHPTNPDLVYAATNGGVYKSVNRGRNWSLVLSRCISNPVSIGMIWGLTISPDGKTVFAGLWDGTVRMASTWQTSTTSWKHVTTLDGTMLSHLMPDVRDPTGKTLYAAALNKQSGKSNLSAGVYRIEIGSPTRWTLLMDSWAAGVDHTLGPIPRGPYNLVAHGPAFWLAQNPLDRDVIYFSAAAGGLFWRSEGAPSSLEDPQAPSQPSAPPLPTAPPAIPTVQPTATSPPAVPPLPTSTPTLL